MRVLHLLKTSTGAGWAYRQMRELVRLGVQVHGAMPPDGPLIEAYRNAGVTVHPVQLNIPIARPWKFADTFRSLRRLVEEVRPDILHSHFVGTTLSMRLGLGRRHPLPRLFQVPGPLHLEHALYARAELETAGPSDYWVGSCRWTCDRYRRSGVPPSRVFLSYYGVDLEEFHRREGSQVRSGLRLSPESRIVGMVAYMYPPKWYLGQTRGLKGHEDFVEALAICRRKDPRILGVVVGGAWNGAHAYERKVRDYGRRLCGDNLVFLGTRGDVPDLYSIFDVVVHPSHSENVGGAAESLLLAVPTIATQVGGFPDLISHGQTGWLVPPRDPKELAERILDVLADLDRAREIARNGEARARELFDCRRTSREVRDIYERVLST